MDIKDFVKEVLMQLDAAVSEANGSTNRVIRFSENDSKRTVEFDIATSAEQTGSKKGKAGG